MIVHTETGSRYEIDLEKKTWARIQEPTIVSEYPLRTKTGTFIGMNSVVIGRPMTLICPPITEGTSGRVIHTSFVVKIEE